MLLPAERLLGLLQVEASRGGGGVDPSEEASTRQSALAALRLLLAREQGGVATVHRQIDRTLAVLDELLGILPAAARQSLQMIADVRTAAIKARQVKGLQEIENAWRLLLTRLDELVWAMCSHNDIGAQTKSRMVEIFAGWESGELGSETGSASHADAVPPLDGVRLAAYLQDRFSDETLQVTSFRALTGGFGKETFLFNVEGQALAGALVMRRDPPTPIIENDCHYIKKEFEIVQALRRHGFPAPDALWLDLDHALLPGGDFMIMRRSAGVNGGSILGPRAALSRDLVETLARMLGRLHSLPCMAELGAHSESINRDVAGLSLEACVRKYLRGWQELARKSAHVPSPFITTLFDWLLDRVPTGGGRPTLLHGDYGVHNFLIDDGRLTAVLDWEYAHLGDPAEELAFVRNNLGEALDWELFMHCYREAGGDEIDAARLHFFQIWGHLRSTISANLATAMLFDGRATDIKFAVLPHAYIPKFIRAAQALLGTSS